MRAHRKVLCALTALCAILAGCGGKPFSSASGGQSARLLAAVDNTTQAKTARVALELSGASGKQSVTESGDGLVDFGSHAVQLSVNVALAGMHFTVELRELDGKTYARASGPGESNSWRSMNAAASTSASENSLDPSQFLSYLRGVAGAVRTIGDERVRDADTTHYAATIDPAQIAAHASSTQDREAASAAQRVFAGMNSVPVDVWVDGQNRLRKFEMAVAFGGESSIAAGTTAKITIEFYDFGVPVHVDAPTGATDATGGAQDRATQSDLRNALTAEKVVYTDNQEYDSSPDHMKTIESSLDWGGKLKALV